MVQVWKSEQESEQKTRVAAALDSHREDEAQVNGLTKQGFALWRGVLSALAPTRQREPTTSAIRTSRINLARCGEQGEQRASRANAI